MQGGQNTRKGMRGGAGEEGVMGARRTERRLKWREGGVGERGGEKEVGESQGPFWEEEGG